MRFRGARRCESQPSGAVQTSVLRAFSTFANAIRNVWAKFGRDLLTFANVICNVRAALGRDFSMLADAIRNVRARFVRDCSKFQDAIRNVRAPFVRDLPPLADAIPNVWAPLGLDSSTFADAIQNVRAHFGRDFSMFADAIRNVRAPFGGDFYTSQMRFATFRRRSGDRPANVFLLANLPLIFNRSKLQARLCAQPRPLYPQRPCGERRTLGDDAAQHYDPRAFSYSVTCH